MTTQNAPDIPGFTYMGDLNILDGGRYFSDDDDIIEVISAADLDGSEYLVISGYVYTSRKLSEWRRVIDSCGEWFDSWVKRLTWTREQRRTSLREAMVGYYGYDTRDERVIPATDDDEQDYQAVVAAINELT